MAWRDSRASRRRLFLFSLSIVFGIAALVAVGSLGDGLASAVRLQAKAMLGADLVVSSRSPIGAGARQFLASLGGRQAEESAFSSMMVFPTAAGATRLVQVRAMAGAFPFYGDFIAEPSDAVARLRRGGRVAVLEDTLLAQFNVRVGDTVRLGRADFTVVGALKKIAGESLALALLAPRALVPMDALAGSGLDANGSLVRHSIALKLPEGADPEAIAGAMREAFGAQRLSFETAARRARELGRTLDDADAYLSLVGFVAVLLGSVGVASAVHVYVRQKRGTIAVLRCLGASGRQTFAIFLVQGAALGVIGAVVGAAIGAALQAVLQHALKGVLPIPLEFGISWPAVARGAGSGFAVCVLFSLLPLAEIRRLSPLGALRPAGLGRAAPPDPWLPAIAGAAAAAVAGFAVLQAGSLRTGLGFTAALGLALGALWALAWLTARAARRLPLRRFPYAVRQGVANLHRPDNRTVLLIVSLGLGTFLVLTMALARSTLLGEIEGVGGAGRPNLLFFDVQDDQIGPLGRLLAARGAPILREAPVVTMKIASVNGRSVDDILDDPKSRLPSWTLRREYRSTYRDRLSDTERVVAGAFVGEAGPGERVVPISIEESLARDMQVGLGDEIDWDVQGVPMRTRLSSLRSVQWRRLEPNFFVVFPKGVLEAAPKFRMASARAATPAQSAELQRAVAAAFPNVTAIDLALVLETVDGILGKIAFAVNFMAQFTVATGLVVLAGATVNARLQRRREALLLRVLGAPGSRIAAIQAVEHAVLGALAAAVGAALAYVAAAILARAVFGVEPIAPPIALPAAIAAVSALTLATGWAFDRGLARLPPLEALRSDEA
jgi:putative ABC transport system permease protein